MVDPTLSRLTGQATPNAEGQSIRIAQSTEKLEGLDPLFAQPL